MTTKHARVSSARRAIPAVSLVLFGLAAFAACSGAEEKEPPRATAAPDAGARALPPGEALRVVREAAAETASLKHVSVEAVSALREHGGRLLRKRTDSGTGFALDVDLPATYLEASRAWPIGEERQALSLRPLVGGDALAEVTDDGHAIFRDVYGHTDVIQSLTETALHQTIILRDAQTPEYMSWELAPAAGARLTPVEIDGGEIVLVDDKGVGRLKLSAAKLVDAYGQERTLPVALVGTDLGIAIDRRGVAYPAALTFSVSAPAAGEQFAVAPVQIKGRVMVILDTSGSMLWQFGGDFDAPGEGYEYQSCSGNGDCIDDCINSRCDCNADNDCGGNGYTCSSSSPRGVCRRPAAADGDGSSVFCDNNIGTAFNCGLANQTCSVANGGTPHWRLANAVTAPSRMYSAKQALTNVVTAHAGLLDFGLERYAENSGCVNSTYCCNPALGTTTAGRCRDRGFYYDPLFPPTATANDLTYSGSCGTAAQGGRVLVQPGPTSGAAILPWVDQVENFCSNGSGAPRNPELRGGGSTPLARSVQTAISDWYQPIFNAGLAGDPLLNCRPYVLVVMTDGDDTCGASTSGDPSQTVAALRAINTTNPVTIYTLGMGDAAGLNTAELDAMQVAGGSGQTVAPIAANQTEIEAAFADIVARTVKFELCNGADDNCNVRVDEGLGVYKECVLTADCGNASSTCDPLGTGRCTCTQDAHCGTGYLCGAGTGTRFCRPACTVGQGTCQRNGIRECGAGAGQCCVNDATAGCTTLSPGAPGTEICNNLDDNCNGIIDDVPGGCQGCIPLPEVCDGDDDNCNGLIDDSPTDVGLPCGSDIGICSPGTTACVSGVLRCQGGNGGLTTDPCNALDDNCDTVVDGSTQACYTGPGGTQDVGICRGGTQQCTATVPNVPAFGPCVGQILPGAETCNGLDDNCNGTIDDVTGVGGSCCPGGSCGTGICRAGTQQCSGGTLQCIGAISPGIEVCNGIDDNCNGIVDDVAGVGGSCCPSGNCGTGVCTAGTLACSGNTLACQNATGPSTEICDGIDNNCNGQVDDLPGRGQACCPTGRSCGVGICTGGTLQCATGSQQLQCTGGSGAGTEVCNGLDDNCNGLVDDVPGSGVSCCASGNCGTGICTSGVRQCVGTTLTCVGETTPGAEVCNSLDDNCNGTVDDVSGVGGTCCRFRDPSGAPLCGTGTCTGGTLQCQSGSATPVCSGGAGPVVESCNGLDDDCDGTVDDLPGGTVGQACCPSNRCGTGICRAGSLACGPNGILQCNGAVNPGAEVCNSLDDDCDGDIDDVPGAGQACCPPGVPCGTGICRSGALQCASGSQQLQCRGFVDRGIEVCNGIDDDCNGLIDDVPGSGSSCCTSGLCGTGVCTNGVQRCVGTDLECTDEVLPGTEICDGTDNDCNGEPDDVVGVNEACCRFQDSSGGNLCGTGICGNGTRQCVPGQTTPQCTGGTGPAPELCNGVDDNCNGTVDDLPGGVVGGACCPSGRCGTGICLAGSLRCGPNGIECGGAVNPQGEICDGLDNDCNGVVDDVPGLGTACCPSGRCGTGICTAGTLVCRATAGQFALECDGAVDATTEICDDLDNDCNGIRDDVPGLGVPCCPPGSPAGDAPGACNKGVCRPGVVRCDVPNQTTMCSGGQGPNANLCDGRDNNCNGSVDETDEVDDDPAIGVACNPPVAPKDQPPCAPGVMICQGARAVCDGEIGPGKEVCDGEDNDCDGVADVGAECPPASACLAGACRIQCGGGEFQRCPGGLTCIAGFCVPQGGNGAGGRGGGAGGGSVGGGANTGGGSVGGGANTGGGSVGGGANTGGGSVGGGANTGGGNGEGGSAGGPDGGSGNSPNAGGGPIGAGASPGNAGSGTDNPNDAYGLATGGGGCACRAANDGPSSRHGLALGLLVGIGLVTRRRGRRAA